MGFLLFFWGVMSLVVCVQYPQLLVNETTGQPQDYNPAATNPFYDPWTDDPWEFDLQDHHHSILEASVVLIFSFYGILRMMNILRIIHEDDEEARWSDFWSLCETL